MFCCTGRADHVQTPYEQKEGCSCLCGVVRVMILGEPLKTTLCHCQDCRKWTGSVGQMAVWYHREDVLCSGELAEFGTSSRVRKSCAECHSHILTSLPRAGLIEVCVGSASQLSLNAHFFYVTPMIDFGDDVPKFVDFPASLGGSGVQASSWDLHRDVTQAFHGSCLCGSVFVSISGEPKTTAFCHCLVCRSWTGSSGHFAVVFDEDLVQISGELISTRHGHRNCARCLACITSRHSAAAPGFLEVCGGILHSPPRVQAHWNYGQRILSVKDGLAKFKDLPTELGGSGDVLGQEMAAPYAVTLERKGEGHEDLGLELSFAGRKCRVLKVRRHSLIHDWNQSCACDSVVGIYDRLISINGRTPTTPEEGEALGRETGKLVLIFAKFQYFE
ncbi:unnamed protein product [Symbiodinium natans]|uniref:CENP-V/GFA domain-containing protein n=1 Tax=Symbiodinium natans TaxID=878477 RepID=A0A812NBN9_9DINO|nr:unnamed protein product [Symbiodinium natans]